MHGSSELYGPVGFQGKALLQARGPAAQSAASQGGGKQATFSPSARDGFVSWWPCHPGRVVCKSGERRSHYTKPDCKPANAVG